VAGGAGGDCFIERVWAPPRPRLCRREVCTRADGRLALKRVIAAVIAFVVTIVIAPMVRAESEGTTETDALIAQAEKALAEGQANDAIAAFEALADRGVIDAALSFDRGLAYAQRVRIGAEVAGDLGRAVHGFEEARELTRDAKLAEAAARAVSVVRSEVARRRAQAGDPVDLDPGVSLARAVVGLASEDGWAAAALVMSVLFGAALFVRALSVARRTRIGAAIAMGISAPSLVLCVVLALGAREVRLELREGVVVSATARPADDRHIAIEGARALPEGGRVRILESGPGWTRVGWAAAPNAGPGAPTAAWIPSTAVRELAKAD
jgi:hypothetical protein